MRLITILFLAFLMTFSCAEEKEILRPQNFNSVEVEPIFQDSTVSIRAIDFDKDYIYYGGSNQVGLRALNNENKIDLTGYQVPNVKVHYSETFLHNDKPLAFRAIESVNGSLFVLSVANPAKLYKKTADANEFELVYEEINEKVFYDAMKFWNEDEGIAIGDPTDNCMSIIVTRDGGNSWTKLPCDQLPEAIEGEAAFAASDSNIAIVDDHTWVATGGKASRVLYSADKGKSWEVFNTPIIQGLATNGMYSIDFYDKDNGFAIGGDYTKAADSSANKIRSYDGGKTWQLVAENQSPGYRSCVQYVPNGKAQELVAVGFKGIDYSNDAGNTWKHLSDEGFYTIRFINDSTAYAAGRGRISKLTFKE